MEECLAKLDIIKSLIVITAVLTQTQILAFTLLLIRMRRS